jgi:hypothetical protein
MISAGIQQTLAQDLGGSVWARHLTQPRRTDNFWTEMKLELSCEGYVHQKLKNGMCRSYKE